ncbi:TNA1 is necessary for nicotinic acid import into the cell [Colletotrichum karsti]|uniref:TNA1 is necessary for nicotinic acid import into the cell n=1 Tax=Colletotrichum karsti TaxID=1095194 RepID=A0A9P6HZ96_9PEZI|nr:TNA1 is necessary for nicotinic acid import into the cell [Colletotrichum karsti]KAF9872887.1 TNA1 is necessary for nicotinic acid import into the cell [Colletotrichum karsti]
MPPPNSDAIENESQKKTIDTTDASKASSEGQTTEWRTRPLPELLRDLSEEEFKALEKRLLRKVDLRMLPTMILIYIMNYLDRNAIGSARLAGLEKDLGLTGNEFQTCVSILFVGYILMQVPSNLFLNKIGRPAMYLTGCMAVWGVLCACSGAAQNFGGLLATRFLLGFVEAAFYPGCLATLSAWYVRKELGVRTGLFYSGSMLSGAFSGLIAAGITNGMDGLAGLLAWRWLFIIEGSLTVLIAIGAFFILPDFPANTKWLTEQERQMAMWRMENDAAGEEDWTSSSSQPILAGFKMIMVDPINWILVVLVYGAASAISINSFFPTVVGSLGKDRITTLLLTSPPYLLACIACAGVSWNADRTSERFWHTVVPLSCSLIGFIVSSAATGIGPRYFGAMIMLPGIYTGFNMSMVWTANTMYRPAAKRAAAVAFNNAFSTFSGIYGSYLYPNDAAPRFVLAFSVNAAMAVMAIIASVVLHFVLKRENRKLELKEQEAEAAGRLDAAGKGFRYLI